MGRSYYALQYTNHNSAICVSVRFSSYIFDPQTGVLTRFGTRLRLEGQPAKVLETLLASPGEVVSRSELIKILWPGEKVGDFDRRLDKAVAKLRAALNESPTNPRFFETLKGKGYRFFAPVEAEFAPVEVLALPIEPPLPGTTLPLPQSLESPDQEVDSKQSSRSRWTISAVTSRLQSRRLLTAALIAAVIFIAGWSTSHYLSNHRGHTTILVLGFRNSAAPTHDLWISRFISDWMAADLRLSSNVQLLFGGGTPEMRPWTSAEGCGNPPGSALQAAAVAYDADMVLYGEYGSSPAAESGGQWSLTLCLASTRTLNSPVVVSFTDSQDDIPKLLAEAGERLRGAAGFKAVPPEAIASLRAEFPHTPDAVRTYSEGVSALDLGELTRAAVLLTIAAQLEPRAPAVHAALAQAWSQLDAQEASRSEATLATQMAQPLSNELQLKYAELEAEARLDWPSAAELCSKLRQMAPQNLEYAVSLARAEFRAGRADQALKTIHSAQSAPYAIHNDPRL